MTIMQTSTPLYYPVLLQDVKDYLKVTNEDTDAEITGLIASATKSAETFCNRPFIQREFTETFDYFPACIRPEKCPIISVTSIEYVDQDAQTQNYTTYQLDKGSKFIQGRIIPNNDSYWPSTKSVLNAVTLKYEAGYGADWNTVPEDVKMAIRYLVSLYFNKRTPISEHGEMDKTVTHLLMGERIPII